MLFEDNKHISDTELKERYKTTFIPRLVDSYWYWYWSNQGSSDLVVGIKRGIREAMYNYLAHDNLPYASHRIDNLLQIFKPEHWK